MKRIISIFILISAFIATAFAQTETAICPTLSVTGGGVVRSGETMNFTVNIAGLSDTSTLKYEWEISNGTISSGPGTPTITVDTTGLNTDITAKVKVIGLSENCANTASEIGTALPISDPQLFDEFGKLSNNDVAARIYNIYVELGNNPDVQGYIINNGTDREFAARKRQIESAIRRFKLDASRVTIVYGGANSRGKGVWTKVWIIPRGAEVSLYTDHE